jgi:hypothetical protein
MHVGRQALEGRSRSALVSETQESFVLDDATLERVRDLDVAEPERTESELLEMQDIARTEMARRRKRLGNLTPDQELAVETLLISTVSRISEIVAALEL